MPENRPSILIIEDQKFCSDLFVAAFGGYTVYTACDGGEGLRVYHKYRPDIVFLDIGLPDMPGFDVLKKLRMRDPDAYVVMLSSMNSKDYITRCRQMGAKGFLSKPYQKDYIAGEIERYIEAHR